MFGESDTLKRSDTTAVTRLPNLFPDAGQLIVAKSRWPNSDRGAPLISA